MWEQGGPTQPLVMRTSGHVFVESINSNEFSTRISRYCRTASLSRISLAAGNFTRLSLEVVSFLNFENKHELDLVE